MNNRDHMIKGFPKTYSYGVLLLFTIYVAILCFGGFFVDWREFVFEPYLLNRDLSLYKDIATQHTPLLTEFMAVAYRLLGNDVLIRKILLIIVSAAVALLTYQVTKRLTGERAAFASILLLTVLWPFYGGTEFWFDSFLPVFYLLALLFIIKKKTGIWLFLAGISMGLSFLVKQSGAYVAFVIFIFLFFRSLPVIQRIKDSLIYILGAAFPVAIMILVLLYRGQLREAFFWVISYNMSGLYIKYGLLPPSLVEIVRLLILVSPALVLFLYAPFVKPKKAWITWEFKLIFYIGFSAALAILPRWGRFHVVSAVPFLVLVLVMSSQIFLSSVDSSAETHSRRSKVVRILFALWLIFIFLDIGMFYPPRLLNRIIPGFSSHWPFHSYEPPDWFDESYQRYLKDMPEIGKYLEEATSPKDKIFTWGWESSQIYMESNRLPAGMYYYALPWFVHLPRFKSDLLKTFHEGRPRYVIETKKSRYPGTPSLKELGVNLKMMGYMLLIDEKERFPEVYIWKRTTL